MISSFLSRDLEGKLKNGAVLDLEVDIKQLQKVSAQALNQEAPSSA